ncbi:hypothetical protein GA0070215_11355 [Micromonospora marina]|uniref:Uncharacterized protein n=1 Tax=Micromonospora marina TaxID=307120 RepID=A0A1C4YWX3_9ACTN|nr:hypothetical protein GA0070215_11355 [Micromonospora marina]
MRSGDRQALAAAARDRTAAAGLSGTGSRTEPRGQGSRLAWCSPPNVITVVPAGSARASRFSASVVFRVKIT